MSQHCEHLNDDDTFKGGFDGCVAHMQAECGGSHSEESAKKICGRIAADKAKNSPQSTVHSPQSASAPLHGAASNSPQSTVHSPQSASAPLHGAASDGKTVDCGLGTVDSEPLIARFALPLPANAPTELMVLPAGEHTGCFSQGGRPVTRTVAVGLDAALALQRQLEAVSARSAHKPYFDFNHDDDRRAAAPKLFYWKDGEKPGVYAQVEWTGSGAEAVKARDYQAFSMVFYTDKNNPARVIANPEAKLNFGGLVNDPAFKEISPITAKNFAHETHETHENPISAASAAATANPNPGESQTSHGVNQNKNNMSPENQTAVAAPVASASDSRHTALEAENTDLRAKLAAADAAIKADKALRAKEAIAAAVKRGALAPKDEALQAKWQKWLEDSPEMLDALSAIPDNPALSALSLTHSHTHSLTHGAGALEAREGPKRIIQAYGALVAKQAKVAGGDWNAFKGRGEISREMSALWAKELRDNKDILDMPLSGADFTDPLGGLGTLSGTLVAQRTLQLFKLQFPAISRVYTDFSDSPAMYKQTEATRVVIVPPVQTYNAATGADGRPLGWNTTAEGQTKDVLLTLDEHIGVPIVFDSNMLASTVRRLFDEQAPAASYALAKYFVEKIYKLLTPANFNAYAVINGAKVPAAYVTYAKDLGDFARSSLVDLATIFNPNEVPIMDRTVLLNSQYYGQLSKDPSLVTFYAGQRQPEIITDNQLPKLGTFVPVEAPNLLNKNATPNLVGFALHKAAIVAKTRLSNDYTLALPGSSYGSVTTITDPDLGISVVLVMYVNHTQAYAEWRIEAMLGAAVGDNRGGLCITSQ